MTPEILAPVGGKEQLDAAIRAGADAVYLGTQSFNARRNAQNFTAGSFPPWFRRVTGRGCGST